jgi:alkylhydroperoxidase/carboxymuconolactone decarboxylase family protein YurZ
MNPSKDAPKTYHEFRARFPKLAEAWDLTHEGSRAGPLDAKAQLLVKLGISIGAMREGAVHSAVRKATQAGIDPGAIEQTVALAASTLGFPATVAVWTWVRDVLAQSARPK